jgi:potassium channel subfamily K
LLLAIPTMTMLISRMSDTLVRAYNRATGVLATWTFVLPTQGQWGVVRGSVPRVGTSPYKEAVASRCP